MRRPILASGTLLAGTLVLGACAALGGGGSPEVRTIAVRAEADADAVAAALQAADPRAVFLSSSRSVQWFEEVAAATGMELSGPGMMGGVRMGFLGPEPVGDTTITLPYDGGAITIHDALYELAGDRLLDLIAFRIESPRQARPAIAALLEYVATDVSNAAALVMAVAVPSAAVGDSVARMLSPAYFDALRCEVGSAPRSEREELRLFYGPAARMYCEDADVEETEVGEWIRAELVLGRR